MSFQRLLESYDQKCQAAEQTVRVEYNPEADISDVDRHQLAEARSQAMDALKDMELFNQQLDYFNKYTALRAYSSLPMSIAVIVIDVVAFTVGGSVLSVICGLLALFLAIRLIADIWTIYKALSVRPGNLTHTAHASLGLHRGIKQGFDQVMGL